MAGSPHGGRPRKRRGQGSERGSTARRVRGWPGRGGGPRGRPRARCRRLRRQGGEGGCDGGRRRGGRPGSSAGGSAPSSPATSGSSCSTTSGCATRSAGTRSTADPGLPRVAASGSPRLRSRRLDAEIGARHQTGSWTRARRVSSPKDEGHDSQLRAPGRSRNLPAALARKARPLPWKPRDPYPSGTEARGGGPAASSRRPATRRASVAEAVALVRRRTGKVRA